MGLIDNQEIELPRVDPIIGTWQDLPEHPQWPLSFEEVNGRDEPWKMVPRIHVNSTLPPQVLHELAVHDAEIQAELVPHLLVPLDLQRRWTDNQNLSGPVADDEFECHHPRLDGLAQTNVIGH